MTTSKLLKAFMAVGLLAGPTSLLSSNVAHAQAGATVGSARGVIKDKGQGTPAAGATVIATSASLQGEQVVLTDDQGIFFLTSLPPGNYTLTIYYADRTFSRANVVVAVGKEAFVSVTVDSSAKSTGGTGKDGKGEIIEIQGTAPVIDQGSTKTGLTLTDDYTRNIPSGRTFGAVIGQAAGSQGDIYGTSIAGATSAENTYIVEGINTTDTGFGGISSNLPNEFIQETEVITGGYNAEYGRATGGIINVVTKSGTNEFHGSVFGYFRPGAFISKADTVREEGGSINSATDLNYNLDAGAEIGGPIIKDKLWFHIGLNPSFTKRTTTRTVQSQIDEDQDGVPDVDESGLTKHGEVVDTAKIPANFKTYYFTAKINGAVDANNQFQVSAFGNPRSADDVFSLTRNPAATKWAYDDGAYDVSAKWTSKFNDGKTQIDAVGGYHRGYETQKPFRAADNVSRIAYNYERSLYDFSDLENSSIQAACQDDTATDAYKNITNCPVTGYAEQGLGFLERRVNDRKSAVLTLTQRVKAIGYHTFKGGLEVESSGYNAHRGYTGGHIYLRLAADTATTEGRWRDQTTTGFERNLTDAERMTLTDADPSNDFAPAAVDEVLCGGGRAVCKDIKEINANTTNRSIGAFVQDEWQLRPNFSINVGIRYEQQVGYTADEIAGTFQPSGEKVP
ncbi:MAG: TonB-dependent receptor, partial [Proteobacteria bacterium]|nr:TonB-dependent receptor [Pseudomonadota bacterium]